LEYSGGSVVLVVVVLVVVVLVVVVLVVVTATRVGRTIAIVVVVVLVKVVVLAGNFNMAVTILVGSSPAIGTTLSFGRLPPKQETIHANTAIRRLATKRGYMASPVGCCEVSYTGTGPCGALEFTPNGGNPP
jgi:hypothetical protein